MLRLNPNDNQGIRYELASCLMKSGDTEALKELLKEYDEDGSPLWLYTQALLAYRENWRRKPYVRTGMFLALWLGRRK